ncbi:MAG: FAD-dependent monooxygenase [Planctomycetes bacterium]|nr:FAD-dependent monooxygenase [Planctomycetota bacterium]
MSDPHALETYRLFDLALAVGEPEARLVDKARARLGLAPEELAGLRIARKALDARWRNGARRLEFVCHVDVVVRPGALRSAAAKRELAGGKLKRAPETGRTRVDGLDDAARARRALVVGSGPAGLFAAGLLAKNGLAVTLIERGPPVEERSRPLVQFHRTRVVDPEANLLFGEGGAGTYSDGKIYTRVDDPLEVVLLDELVACGAPPSIAYDSLAHIGTDRLHRILPTLRARMRADGVRFLFRTRLEGLSLRGDGERAVVAADTTAGPIECEVCFLAVGHSARDTWRTLHAQGVPFEAKPFQLGLRIEHPQELVDRARYGAATRQLGAASYNLISKSDGALPAAYSFCMCPGGRIVASVNEPGLLCTNGMSNSRHSSGWATAALVTTFGSAEFGSQPFDGVRFQRELEARFFEAGGGDYTAPAQTAADFLAGRKGASVRHSTYPFGTVSARLDELVPPVARGALARALERFDRQLPGFASADGLFVGLESRSSGPVRVPRDRQSRLARGFSNLYPLGEGAGYAGGIMSAALDGANAALSYLDSLARPSAAR